MKAILFLLLFAATFCRGADLDARWIGNASLRVYNNLTCPSVRISYQKGGLSKDTLVEVNSGSFRDVIIDGLQYGSTVRLKSDGNGCSSGWVTVTLDRTLAVGMEVKYRKTEEAIVLTFDRGEVQKSVDGRTFYRLGDYVNGYVDLLPEARNFYRVKSRNGDLSPVLYVPFEKRSYKVYNYDGQLVAVTPDISPYRWNRLFIISK